MSSLVRPAQNPVITAAQCVCPERGFAPIEHDMVGDVEEPEHRDRELRSEITHLAIEAYRREEISRGRVLELSKMLGMKGDVLLRLAEAARGE